MNTYEQKQEDRKERYLDRSKKLSAESDSALSHAKSMTSCIPYGQPILVGHHSEKKHRSAIKRADNAIDKALELDKKAHYYEEKAHSVGTAGVSSDDPDAIIKLSVKIDLLKAGNERLKESNKLWRITYNKVAKDMGLKNRTGKDAFYANDDEIQAFKMAIEAFKVIDNDASLSLLDMVKTVSYNPSKIKPFYPDTTEIRRLEKRIKDLRAIASFDHKEIVKDSYTLVQDPDENRLMFYFDGKPAEAIRKILKSHSFKWSPSRKAWVRMITGNAMYSVKRALIQLDALENDEVVA